MLQIYLKFVLMIRNDKIRDRTERNTDIAKCLVVQNEFELLYNIIIFSCFMERYNIFAVKYQP